MKKLFFILLALSIGWALYAFAPFKSNETERKAPEAAIVAIKQILSNPKQYHGKPVSVQGKVVLSFSLGLKIYELDDSTGKILVKTDSAVPMTGQIVKVRGNVKQVFKLFERHVVFIEEIGP